MGRIYIKLLQQFEKYVNIICIEIYKAVSKAKYGKYKVLKER